MNFCDGGPDATVRFCDSAKIVALVARAARTLTGPGTVPEATVTVTNPLESVVPLVWLSVTPAGGC